MDIHAPVDNGGTLLVPAWDSLPALIEQNRKLRASWQVDILGRSLVSLIAEARRSLIAEAIRYTSQYRDIPPFAVGQVAAGPLAMGGHQPELFHPGVWLKNFVLDELAQRVGGIALNLVIDADVPKSHTLPVLSGTVDHPEQLKLPFDEQVGLVPYEEWRIANEQQFARFGLLACELLKPLVAEPWLKEFWPSVIERGRATGLVGMAFAQSRHQLEGQMGLTTLELPQSVMCRQPVFYYFMAHVLGNLEMLRDLYNEAIRNYRQTNRVRSASHPAPELARSGEWIQIPFWSWSVEHPQRQKSIYAARRGGELILNNFNGWEFRLPDPLNNAEGAVAALTALETRGIKLRTVALLTTFFTRVFLSDLFVHGIGGGKYDTVTNELIRGFYGIEPPRYAIATGTLRLPINRPRVSIEDLRENARRQWALLHHPELFLSDDLPTEARSQVEQKLAWIATPATLANARDRCHAIRAINAALQAEVAGHRRRLIDERSQLERLWRHEQLLGWREYPWPMHPRTTLENFLLAFRRSRP